MSLAPLWVVKPRTGITHVKHTEISGPLNTKTEDRHSFRNKLVSKAACNNGQVDYTPPVLSPSN